MQCSRDNRQGGTSRITSSDLTTQQKVTWERHQLTLSDILQESGQQPVTPKII